MGGRNSTQAPVEEEVVVPVRSDGACSALFMDAGLLRRRRNDILRRLSLSTVEEGGEPPQGRGGWVRGAKDWLWRYAPLLLHTGLAVKHWHLATDVRCKMYFLICKELTVRCRVSDVQVRFMV